MQYKIQGKKAKTKKIYRQNLSQHTLWQIKKNEPKTAATTTKNKRHFSDRLRTIEKHSAPHPHMLRDASGQCAAREPLRRRKEHAHRDGNEGVQISEPRVTSGAGYISLGLINSPPTISLKIYGTRIIGREESVGHAG